MGWGSLVAVLLVGWGAAWCITRSRIGALVRVPVETLASKVPLFAWTADLIHCAGCTGFWIGVALGLSHPLLGHGLAGAISTGAAVMGVNAVVDALTGALHRLELYLGDR